MSDPRFTVRWCRRCGNAMQPGYAIYDRGKRITITFINYGEALGHREKIAALYARWGW